MRSGVHCLSHVARACRARCRCSHGLPCLRKLLAPFKTAPKDGAYSLLFVPSLPPQFIIGRYKAARTLRHKAKWEYQGGGDYNFRGPALGCLLRSGGYASVNMPSFLATFLASSPAHRRSGD